MHLLFDYDGTLHETMRIYGPAFRMACEDLAARGLIEPRHDSDAEIAAWLGFSTPEYYHVPLLTAPDGRRLSKRERDLDMGALRERYAPEALVGRLAYLAGLLDAPQSVSACELAADFSWRRVKRENIPIENL